MQVKITRLNHTGEGIATKDDKVIFIPKTIPDDIVEINNIKEHKNYSQATIQKIIEKSPIRESIQCPYYDKCGGCQLLGLPYHKQLDYKKEKVKNILKKYANLDLNPSIKESSPYHYRNKITLHVQNGQIGLFSQNTNSLIPINSCLLIDTSLNDLILLIQAELKLDDINKIILRTANKDIMVKFIGQIDANTLIRKLSSSVKSLYLNDNLIFGQKQIQETLGDYTFNISPASFFQVNHTQTLNLYNQAKEYLGSHNNNVLDLYCGTGTIGIYLSKYCKKITGIELNYSAVKDAEKNIKQNLVTNMTVIEGDVGSLLTNNDYYDAIIVDPPRSGLDKRTRKTLKQIKSPKIIYISCDPITLARDLNDLKEIYNIQDISLFDMFPNTYHVESVVLMSLKK